MLSDLGIKREGPCSESEINTYFPPPSHLPCFPTHHCGLDVRHTLWLVSNSTFLNGIAICVPHSDAPGAR